MLIGILTLIIGLMEHTLSSANSLKAITYSENSNLEGREMVDQVLNSQLMTAANSRKRNSDTLFKRLIINKMKSQQTPGTKLRFQDHQYSFPPDNVLVTTATTCRSPFPFKSPSTSFRVTAHHSTTASLPCSAPLTDRLSTSPLLRKTYLSLNRPPSPRTRLTLPHSLSM